MKKEIIIKVIASAKFIDVYAVSGASKNSHDNKSTDLIEKHEKKATHLRPAGVK